MDGLLSATPRCGPAGWSHPEWAGGVYPRPLKRSFHPLEYLAGYFDTVEIDSTFYRPLRPEISRLWVSRVDRARSFQFTAKLPRRFTHERVLEVGEITEFTDGIKPILKAGRLGAVLMQFPWSFRFTSENREFFIRLRRTFHEFPLVAEMRHSSWLLEEATGTFIDYKVGFCNIDQPEHVNAMPPSAVLTSSVAYFRLHGRAAAGWVREFEAGSAAGRGSAYLYSTAELEAWKDRISRISAHAAQTFVTFTNSAGGRSVVNALQLQAMIDPERRRAPSALMARFRSELSGFRPDRAIQEPLFNEPERAVA